MLVVAAVDDGFVLGRFGHNDEGAVTITQVQALRACRNAGISIPTKVINKAVKYVVDSANPDGGIRYSGDVAKAIAAKA